MQLIAPINTTKVKRTLLVIVAFTILFAQLDARHFNGVSEAMDESSATRYANRLYFVVSTLSTVGSGDVTPKTQRCRMAVTAMILLMLTVLAA